MILNTWRKIRDWAEHRMHLEWMRQYSHDRKCPRCLRWFGDAGGWETVQDISYEHQTITCGTCGHTSRWNMVVSMLPVSEPMTIGGYHE